MKKLKLLGMITGGLILLSFFFWFISGGSAESSSSHRVRSNQENTDDDDDVVVTNTIDRATAPDNFDKINMSLRIMPSQNTEGNILILDSTKAESPYVEEYDPEKINLNTQYFMFNKTVNYFPTVHMTESYVPIGTSKPFCMHMSWIRAGNQYQYDKYIEVLDQPNCINA